ANAAPKDTTIEPITAIKEGTCRTSSGKSTLGYQVGVDEAGEIHLRVSSNDGGGFFSNEWISHTAIKTALAEWPADQGVTSMTFRPLFRGKSANTPGFLIAVLCAEGIIEPVGEKKRVHQACDPAAFLASMAALGSGAAPGKPSASKAKSPARAKAKAKAKAPRKTPATTPRKSPARKKSTR
ncbi:MAG: hypothetical protein KDI09_02725, partial [Halioglobus sp.]|nr:hypothetical protein [Halioglobus sp.]